MHADAGRANRITEQPQGSLREQLWPSGTRLLVTALQLPHPSAVPPPSQVGAERAGTLGPQGHGRLRWAKQRGQGSSDILQGRLREGNTDGGQQLG